MRRAASRPIRKALVRLVSITRCHSATERSTKGFRSWMPALFTRMSTAIPCGVELGERVAHRRFVRHVECGFGDRVAFAAKGRCGRCEPSRIGTR